MVERYDPPLGEHGWVDSANAPAGQGALEREQPTRMPDSGASIPELWVQPGRDGARGYREAYGDSAVPPPQHDQRPGGYGEDRAPALGQCYSYRAGYDSRAMPALARHEQHDHRAGSYCEECASALRNAHRHPGPPGKYWVVPPPGDEQHDRGEGAEVVRRAKWAAWPVEPGQLYCGKGGAGDAGQQERRPYGLSMALLGGGKDKKHKGQGHEAMGHPDASGEVGEAGGGEKA